MKIKVLASGSKGNCTLIVSNNTKLLIDAGITELQIKKCLNNVGIDIYDLDGILISHMHSDHIKGLIQIVKKHKLKVYVPPELVYDLTKIIPVEFIIVVNKEFNINDIHVTLIETSHDVVSYGFIVEYDQKSLVYITDTGYINKKYYDITANKNVYIIETNHDEEMLMNGPYPYHLKQRVISDKGHLSNRYAGRYLTKVIGDNTKFILLAHISENNNTYDLALSQVKEELVNSEFDCDNIVIAYQNEGTELIEV
ncbi:MAG: MBL fold metallo-hydrolase [Bacilli bacterium]|nr:MBL fold metallo-hydrolase [Bacilli bacterium]